MSEDALNALPTGYQIQEYRLERVLGVGGFGITYLGYDNNLEKEVAIKEYLPSEFAVRAGELTVHPKSSADGDDYQWGLERFLQEAQTLARFKHHSIVQVYRFFEANNTAYMVMDYENGESFSAVMKRKKGNFSEGELRELLFPVLSGLEEVHKAGVLHRDIKPGNIYIRKDGSPVLLDFGAARDAVGRKSKSLTSIVTPGYAPMEQYYADGNQGPWTDLYAMGAILYQAVAGAIPPEAPARARKDPYVSALERGEGRFSEAFLTAIDRSLSVDEEDRPQDIEDWRKMFAGEAVEPPAGATMLAGAALADAGPAAAETGGAGSPSASPGVSSPGGATMLAGDRLSEGRSHARSGPKSGRQPRMVQSADDVASGRQQGEKSGGAAKWLVAAVVLLSLLGGGGYYAMTAFGPGGDNGNTGTDLGSTAAGSGGTVTEITKGGTGQGDTGQGETGEEGSAAEEAKRKAEEAARLAEERKVKAREEAKARAAAEAAARRKAEAEARARAEAEARRKAEAERKRQEELANRPKVRLVACSAIHPGLGGRIPAQDCGSVRGLLNRVLETSRSGTGGSWRSRDGNYSGRITARPVFKQINGRPCRRFVQTLRENGNVRRVTGAACRDLQRAVWTIMF